MKLRLIEQFQHWAYNAPDATAARQVESNTSISREQLLNRIAALSVKLADSAPTGSVVLICLPNQPEFIVAFLATLAAGLKAFPVSPELAEPELIDVVERSNATVVIGNMPALNVLGTRVPLRFSTDDITALSGESCAVTGSLKRPGRASNAGLLLLSSGTTGKPRIAFRDAASLDAVSDAMVSAIGFTNADHVLACVPLCHSYGIEHGLLAPVWAGSCVHLMQGFDLRTVIGELGNSPISVFPGVPFMFEILAQHGSATVHALRRAYSAGGPLPRQVADLFAESFGIPVSQLYGATEIGSVTYADPDLPGFNPASVGRAMKNVSIRILPPDSRDVSNPVCAGQQGQVAVAAASMLSGYLGGDAAPTADGYFLTGDLGHLDEFGNLTITGRIKLLIDVGGRKVNPVEVESVLAQHPGVASCVVVPVHVSATVSRLKAIVMPRDNAADLLTEQSLRQFARARLAGYKVPRLFELRDSLPKSPTGKILRDLVDA